MPEIYGGDYIILAASGACDGDVGCFSTASDLYKSQTITAYDRTGSCHQVFVRQHLPHWILPLRDDPDDRSLSTELPLFKRGRVFQERLLSPRVLHFGRQELLWECAGLTTCECTFLEGVKKQQSLLKPLHTRGLEGLRELDTKTSLDVDGSWITIDVLRRGLVNTSRRFLG
jgi:hypothetical protein